MVPFLHSKNIEAGSTGFHSRNCQRTLSRFLQFSLLITLPLILSFQEQLSARQIDFAGVKWNVKTGGPMGPGPNVWSDDARSVWLDSLGLHMTIRFSDGKWYCSEVYTDQFTSYGKHRFLVEGYIDRMDKNIVLGMFLYANDHAEIDIEYSKWGSEDYQLVGSFTVQPYSTEGNSRSFASVLDTALSTHFFDWQPAYVMFGSIQGLHYSAPPSSKKYIQQWLYNGSDNPQQSDNLRTHINFWLMNGLAPSDFSVMEVIIRDVVQPLSPVGIGEIGRTPEFFRLNQNYPNPFNHETVIRYTLPESGFTRLHIYDTLGNSIRTLAEGQSFSGTMEARWDGKSDSGQSLPSGIYFCSLQTGDMRKTIKMVLLK